MDVTQSSERQYLDPSRVRITRDSFGVLHLEVGGERYEGVRPVRAFPLTAPGRMIVLQDAGGSEIGAIADLEHLDARSRQVLEEELEMAYFGPTVLSIRDARSRFGVTTWDLETDRGRRVAYVKDRSDIRTLPGGRIVITDVHGIRYDIPDPRRLDDRSQAFLEAET